jgi:hypothetical protein
MTHNTRTLSTGMLAMFVAVATFAFPGSAFAADRGPHTSSVFQGPKANTGTVSHLYENNRSILRISNDFKVPDTPAPTWRIVDSKGTIYTLDAFKIKGGEKREVMVPAYVNNIAKVQVYCAWAEVLLGEASFSAPVN